MNYIASNDFSFYDNLLDTAVLFNIIPERYVNLDVSPMWRYFARREDIRAKPEM